MEENKEEKQHEANAEESKLQNAVDERRLEPTDLIAKANEAAERQEKANLKHEELLKKQEALAVEKTLGGESNAGTTQELTKEEKLTAQAKEILKGTGFEDRI